MKILLYRWKVFNQDDVKSAIEYFGHEVHDYTETVIDQDDETGFKLRDYAELRQVDVYKRQGNSKGRCSIKASPCKCRQGFMHNS